MTERTPRQLLIDVITRRERDYVPASFYEINPYDTRAWYVQDPSYQNLVQFAREETEVFGHTGPNLGPYLCRPQDVEEEATSWREGSSTFTRTTLHTPKGDLDTLSRYDDGVRTTWHMEHLLKTEEDVERFLSLPLTPPEPETSHIEWMEQQLGENGLPVLGLGDAVAWAAGLLQYESFAVLTKTNLPLLYRLMDTLSERLLEGMRRVAEKTRRVGYRIVGPEYVGPNLTCPEMFERFVVPYDTALVEAIHDNGQDNLAIIHCHGKLRAVTRYLTELGADALEPLEPPPIGDMTMGDLKRELGPHLCLMGGMQFADVDLKSEQEVSEFARSVVREGSSGGGLVVLPTAGPIVSPLQQKTERNMMAFIRAVREAAG